MSAFVYCKGELYHYGVLGMKWGRRRFQNKDGTLTPAGIKRYSENENDTNSKTNKKTKHRVKLEEKYMKSGMSRDEAVSAASRRIKTEKALAATAAVTIAAASAYVIYKKHKQNVAERVDQVIKKGSAFQRIEGEKKTGLFKTKNSNLHSSFYVTDNDYDNKNYKDAFGYIKKQNYGQAYKMNIEAKRDIKIASQKTARDTLQELMKNDPDFRRTLSTRRFSQDLRGEHKIPDKIVDKFKKGETIPDKYLRKIYDNFNSNLVGAPKYGFVADNRDTFYNALKKKGYSGIQDINDLKWSNLRGKNPLIIFDKSKVKVKSIDNILDEVSEKTCSDAYKRMNGLRYKTYIKNNVDKILAVSGAIQIKHLAKMIKKDTSTSQATQSIKTAKKRK